MPIGIALTSLPTGSLQSRQRHPASGGNSQRRPDTQISAYRNCVTKDDVEFVGRNRDHKMGGKRRVDGSALFVLGFIMLAIIS